MDNEKEKVFDELSQPFTAPISQHAVDLLLKALAHLRKDAEMALADDWDRSDGGFEAQIDLIDEIMDKTGLTLPTVK